MRCSHLANTAKCVSAIPQKHCYRNASVQECVPHLSLCIVYNGCLGNHPNALLTFCSVFSATCCIPFLSIEHTSCGVSRRSWWACGCDCLCSFLLPNNFCLSEGKGSRCYHRTSLSASESGNNSLFGCVVELTGRKLCKRLIETHGPWCSFYFTQAQNWHENNPN